VLSVVGEFLPQAVGVAISPIPIIAVILMLFTPRARSNGIAFVLGWVFGLVVVGGIVLAAGVASSDGGESTTSGIVKVVLGVLLLLLAVRSWRSRPAPGDEAEMPGWMDGLDSFTPLKSAGIAALLSGLNPKNLALTAAGMASVSGADLSTAEEIGALAVFVAIASISVAGPVIVFLVWSDRVQPALTSMRDWLAVNNAAVMAVLLLVIGAKLLGDGISILAD
jgi:hypothetical protein